MPKLHSAGYMFKAHRSTETQTCCHSVFLSGFLLVSLPFLSTASLLLCTLGSIKYLTPISWTRLRCVSCRATCPGMKGREWDSPDYSLKGPVEWWVAQFKRDEFFSLEPPGNYCTMFEFGKVCVWERKMRTRKEEGGWENSNIWKENSNIWKSRVSADM